MGFVKTTEIKDDTKSTAPLTLSVNRWSGVRLNKELYDAMERPRWVELEYDAETNTLRVKPAKELAGASEVIAAVVKVPAVVRTNMLKLQRSVCTTRQWLVEHKEGWWYTTSPK